MELLRPEQAGEGAVVEVVAEVEPRHEKTATDPDEIKSCVRIKRLQNT